MRGTVSRGGRARCIVDDLGSRCVRRGAAVQLQGELPAIGGLLACRLCAAGSLFPARPRRLSPSSVLLGGCAQHPHGRLARPELEGRDVEVVGVVATRGSSARCASSSSVESSARLPKSCCSWYRNPWTEDGPALLEQTVHPGERWLFTVRLRRPHGHVNPHGFDYEAWLLERGIGATGYVRQRGAQAPGFTQPCCRLHPKSARGRARAFSGRARRDPGRRHPRRAGNRRPASDLGRRMAPLQPDGRNPPHEISGLHVTLVSGLAAWLVYSDGAACRRAVVRLPARKAAAAAAIAAALAIPCSPASPSPRSAPSGW